GRTGNWKAGTGKVPGHDCAAGSVTADINYVGRFEINVDTVGHPLGNSVRVYLLGKDIQNGRAAARKSRISPTDDCPARAIGNQFRRLLHKEISTYGSTVEGPLHLARTIYPLSVNVCNAGPVILP